MADNRYKNGIHNSLRRHAMESARSLNDAYTLLKRLGWTCHNDETHPTDRVPMLRLGDASIRRNREKSGEWIVEIGGQVFDASGDLIGITAKVRQVLGLPEPAQPEPWFLPNHIIPATAFESALDEFSEALLEEKGWKVKK
jgi:hypothetical protein